MIDRNKHPYVSPNHPYRAMARLLGAERPRNGGVYFIRSGDNGPIKIGYSSNGPQARMGELQVGSPEELKIVGWVPGPKPLEKKIHTFLDGWKIRGEWFEADEVVFSLMGYLQDRSQGWIVEENLPVACPEGTLEVKETSSHTG